MRTFDSNGGRGLALAALLCCELAVGLGCEQERSGGRGGATSNLSGALPSSGKTSSSGTTSGSSTASSCGTTSSGSTTSSSGTTSGGGGTTSGGGGTTSGGGGDAPCNPQPAPGGAALDCDGFTPLGGHVIWTATVPAPMAVTPSQAPGMWSLQGVFVGATGHSFVAMPWATPSSLDGPAGVALDEIDASGDLLGDVGPSDDAVSLTLRGLGVFGARHYVVGVSFAEWLFERMERLASDAAYVVSNRSLLDSGVLLGATGDDAGDTFAMFGAGDNPNPGAVGWGMCWGAEYGNFLVKWGAAGQHAWTQPLPAYTAFPTSLAADGSGGVYLAGALSGPLGFGCPAPSSGSSYVARLGPSGACMWNRGEGLGTGALVMLPGTAGDLTLSNTFQGTIDLGCGSVTSEGTSAYVAQLGPGGACLYSKSFAVGNLGVALFPGGDVLLTTSASGPVDLGGGILAPIGVADAVVVRIGALGQILWSRRFGAPGVTVSCAGALADPKGDVVLPCAYTGAVDFGGGPLGGGGVVKLDGAGTFLWQHGPAVGSAAADPCGAVIVASTCATCAPGGTPGVTVTKLAP